MKKHTPGPWKIRQVPGQLTEMHGKHGELVFRMRSGIMPTNSDGALMEAAPEMFATATAVVEHFFNPDNTYEGLEAKLIELRNAVKKAQGE